MPASPPDVGALRRFTRRLQAGGLPWSTSVIGAASDAVAGFAADHDLVGHREATLVVDREPHVPPAPAGPERYHLVADEDQRQRWNETCDLASALLAGTAGSLLTPELPPSRVARPVLAHRGGTPVATALTVLDEDGWLGLSCWRPSRGRAVPGR